MTDQHAQNTRRLLITGATGGMGRACALLAATEGYHLVLADLSAEKLATLAAECSLQGVKADCHTLDVTVQDSIDDLVAALGAGDGVDGIIHTVGISPQMADWKRIVDVDLIGTIGFLEAARPNLRSGGCTVCITSMSAYMVPANDELEQALSNPLAPDFMETLQKLQGQLTHPGMAYAYSKKALKRYVADRAYAWGKEGKRFVSISPGLIDTEMGRLENDAMENFEAMRSHIALTRLGEAEDIANTALFLVSAKAAYITGCDILVDGGFVGTLHERQRR